MGNDRADRTPRSSHALGVIIDGRAATGIFQTLPMGIGISRAADGVILYANDALGQMLGIEPAEAVGRSAATFYADPGDRAKLLELIQRDGQVHNFQLQVLKAGGAPVWVDLEVNELTFDGQTALLGCFVDVTAPKRYEEMLEDKVRQLEIANDAMIDRELRMVELKEENRRLQALLQERSTPERD